MSKKLGFSSTPLLLEAGNVKKKYPAGLFYWAKSLWACVYECESQPTVWMKGLVSSPSHVSLWSSNLICWWNNCNTWLAAAQIHLGSFPKRLTFVSGSYHEAQAFIQVLDANRHQLSAQIKNCFYYFHNNQSFLGGLRGVCPVMW